MASHVYTLQHDPVDPFEARFQDAFEVRPYTSYQDSDGEDLIPLMGAIRNQNILPGSPTGLGDCASESGCGIREILWNKTNPGQRCPELSSLNLYNNVLIYEGTPGKDVGSRLRDVQEVLLTKGVCPLDLEEWKAANFGAPETVTEEQAALTYRIQAGYWSPTLDEITSALSLHSLPVHLGILVYDSFESEQTMLTGQVPLPQSGESLLGGHAIIGVRNIPSRQVIRTINSWGSDVGIGGLFDIPYAYFQSPHTFMSARVYT